MKILNIIIRLWKQDIILPFSSVSSNVCVFVPSSSNDKHIIIIIFIVYYLQYLCVSTLWSHLIQLQVVFVSLQAHEFQMMRPSCLNVFYSVKTPTLFNQITITQFYNNIYHLTYFFSASLSFLLWLSLLNEDQVVFLLFLNKDTHSTH